MPCPFPGMDPYLEDPARWPAVHTGLIVAIQAQLNRLLPEDLVAEIDEYVWVSEDGVKELLGKPDAFVPDAGAGNETGSGGYPEDPASVSAPTATVTLSATARRKNRVVQIITAKDSHVLTVIEILSPSNKNTGEDRDAYLAKRRECFAARVNVVEIDLLRDGDRLPLGRPRPATTDYRVLVTRAGDYPTGRVWSFSVREPIPVVPVPLDLQTAAVPLDLRACLDVVYEDGKFAAKLNYDEPPEPALSKTDAEWAAELLNKPRKAKT